MGAPILFINSVAWYMRLCDLEENESLDRSDKKLEADMYDQSYNRTVTHAFNAWHSIYICAMYYIGRL